ncbi:MAG TPA: exodeoxyribonuclease VII small subunit [Candidatus Hydrogenedentes bacterium]|nr:exodeoxyribonuclease VII small subunit [Candidatus Hydrogenedentota bacterium]HRZ80889.1 exodeoxyribonuclease VII small subunit [Candidatus Hydrogenedentota bacterium]
MAKGKRAEESFEKDLERLESIVAALEEGGVPLEESLRQFEEGVHLARKCEEVLKSAEKRIELLLKNREGKLETVPFAGDDAPAGADTPPDADDAPWEEEEDGDDGEKELLF